MARTRSPILTVVKFLGEYRIQDAAGQLLGLGTSAVERAMDAHRDSLGFVWTDRQSADRALTLAKETV